MKLFLIFLLLGAGALQAQEDDNTKSNFTGEAKTDFVNSYYWRGYYVYPEGVPAFQPSLTLGFNEPAISLNIWSSLPFKKRSELKDVRDELDLTINYDLVDEDNFGLSLGFVSYLFFVGEFWNTEELYVSSWYDIHNGLGLYAAAYIDVDFYKGLYFNFGPYYDHRLTEDLSLSSKILLSFTKYKGLDFSFIETGFNTSLVYKLTDLYALSAGVLWNYNIEEKNNQYAVNASFTMSW